MRQEKLEAGPSPQITIEVLGHLKLEGWDRTEVEVSGPDEYELRLQITDTRTTLYAANDATVLVPIGATVNLERVHKNANVRNLRGPLNIERVNGNLTVSDVHEVNARRIDGNFVAVKTRHLHCLAVGGNGNLRDIAGNVELSVGGNLDVRKLEGQFSGTAGGNLDLQHVQGNISASAGGNASISLDASTPHPGQVRANAGGNLSANIDGAVNAVIHVVDHRGPRKFSLGDGSGQINLNAGGSISVRTENAEIKDWEFTGQRGGNKRRSVPLGANKQVFIDAGESIKITGHAGTDVIAEKYGSGLDLAEENGVVRISSSSHGSILVPNGSIVHADAGMNVTARDFTGHLVINCGCDLKVRNMVGSIKAEAGSCINAVFKPEGEESNLEAGANVRCRLIAPGNATVAIEDMRGERERVYGDGSQRVRLSAGASASIEIATEDDENAGEGFSFTFDNADFDQKMREFGDKMSNMAREFSSRFEQSNMPGWLSDEMTGMQGRVEEAMRRATEKVNRKVESAMRRAEKRGTRRGPMDFTMHATWDGSPMPPEAPEAPEPPEPPMPPASPSSPTSEERLMILRMLEEKKITAEQAAQLLTALGG